MKIAVYPGSFDPLTNGHLDIIVRSSQLVETLIVAVGTNVGKNPIFTVNERLDFIREATRDLPNVVAEKFSGMTVDFCLQKKANAIIRGVRGIADMDDEFSMALTNRTFTKEVETLFMASASEHSFVSSKLIRETAVLGGKIDHLVPSCVIDKLTEKLKKSI